MTTKTTAINSNQKNRALPELLAPTGSMETLQTAVLYGADAVYLGGEAFGLRAGARNFSREQMKDAVAYAHIHGVKVYVTVNIIAHNEHLKALPEYLEFLQEAGVDALIMSDAGMIHMTRQLAPDLAVHLSTQASAMNYETLKFWRDQGVERAVLARELSLPELQAIHEELGDSLELETFVHGAMCMSISGRCLLSGYLTGREANLGECAQPCRWNYALVEQSRPGEYFPVTEDENGTYIFNSKDLCLVEYLPELIAAGVKSLKIEGRMKTPLYVGVVTKIYREALDDLAKDPALYESKKTYYKNALSMISHRDYTTGFFLGRPGAEAQVYDTAAYIKKIEFAAKVVDAETGLIEQRGRFFRGETLLAIPTEGEIFPFTVEELKDKEGQDRDSAPHAKEELFMRLPEGAHNGMLIARCV